MTAAAAALTGALLGASALFAPASAHTDLVASTPSDGARLDDTPRQITLDFTDEMSPELSTITLSTSAGATRELAVTGGGPSRVVAAVPDAGDLEPAPTAGPQTWLVGYRVVSADGHPVAGQLRFRVPSTPTDPQTGDAADSGSDPSTGTERDRTGPAGAARLPSEQDSSLIPLLATSAAAGVLLLLGGSAAFRLTRRSEPDR